jgi:hypothetical protein
MNKQATTESIQVNGVTLSIVDALSSGPGSVPHTYIVRRPSGRTFTVRQSLGEWVSNEHQGAFNPKRASCEIPVTVTITYVSMCVGCGGYTACDCE